MIKKKLNTGGNIGAGIGATATSFIPGVGPALAPIGGMIGRSIGSLFGKKRKPPKATPIGRTTQATQGYQMGGNLPTATKPIGNDAVRYEGPQHEQGGIPVDQNGNPTNPQQATAEVEGNETRQGDYIFSAELTLPDSDMTFADAHEQLLKKGATEEEIEQLAQLQEQVQEQQGVQGGDEMSTQSWGEQGMFNNGGNLINKNDLSKKLSFLSGKNVGQSTIPIINQPKIEGAGSTKDWTGLAQRYLPSVTRLATAAFAPKPKRIEPQKISASKVSETSPIFNETRRRQASGFRANPNQGSYAQYTGAVNQTAAQEADYAKRAQESNRQTKVYADSQNSQMK
ncbi:MAG: hypothetical protein WD512_04455, partial [Candidatus Paceibacterota bacterium]